MIIYLYVDDMLIVRRKIRLYDAKAHGECVKEGNKIYLHKSKNTFCMHQS